MKATFLRQKSYIVILSLLVLALCLPPAAAGASNSLREPALYQGSLTATPDADAKVGAPGSTVVFYISVASTIRDYVSVETTNTQGWTVNANPNPVDLTVNNADSMELSVEIPPSAQNGAETTVTAQFVYTNNKDVPPISIPLTVKASLPEPTKPPTATRPLVVVSSYSMDKDTIVPGDTFNLYLSLKNEGGKDALNLVFSFAGEDFLPQETGGVVALGSIGADGTSEISQRMWVNTTLWGFTNAVLPVSVTYTDSEGTAYTEKYNLTLAVRGTTYGQAATATPTPTMTPTTAPRPQLVVSGYKADTDPLQPGAVFSLDLDIQNMGNSDAKNVTMVLGGGGSNVDPNASGTPMPGGVSGGSGDLTNFAPIGSSNLVYLGDVPMGSATKANSKLIVNVSANPGAYSLKLSFVYNDARGTRLVDDQVITLLIYQIPQVEVSFYRDPGQIFVMQPNTLPIQVVNLGRKSIVLGNMTVTAENADLMNNVMLVGTLDMGGYFPLDVMLIPQAPGPMDVNIKINYTDDFNQPRTITQTIQLEVMEGGPMGGEGMEGPVLGPDGMPIDPGMGEMPVEGMDAVEETLWDKVLRFFKGLIGLDSAPPQPEQPIMPGGEEMPGEGVPQGGGGGKG